MKHGILRASLAAILGLGLTACAPGAGRTFPRSPGVSRPPVPVEVSPHLSELLALLRREPGAVPEFAQDSTTPIVQWRAIVTARGPEALPTFSPVQSASLDSDRALDRRRTVAPHSWLVLIDDTGRIFYWVPVDDPLAVRLEAFPERRENTIRGGHKRIEQGVAAVRIPFRSRAIVYWAAPDLPVRPIYPGSVYRFGEKATGRIESVVPAD